MKNTKKASFLVLLLSAIVLSGCGKETTGKSTVNNYYSGSSSSSSSTTTADGTTCDGVAKSGATSCYYTNIPRFVFSGPGTYNNGATVYWSSNTNLPSYVSKNQFRSDAYISFRMKPSYGSAYESTLQGKKCAIDTLTNFSKLKVWVMLRRASDSIGPIKEMTASVNSYSNTVSFDVSSFSTTDPYIMEIVGVNSNHRCNAKYGTAMSGCPDMYYDIPYVTNTTGYTECAAFNVEMATDSTYGFPL